MRGASGEELAVGRLFCGWEMEEKVPEIEEAINAVMWLALIPN